MILCGPGSAIPHIAAAISQHVDMHIKVEPAAESYEPKNAFGKGTLEWDVCHSDDCPAGLLSEVAREEKTKRLLSKSIVAGVAVASLIMGGEYMMMAKSHQQIIQMMSLDSERTSDVNQYHERVLTASNMSSIIGEVSELVVDTVSSIPQWQGSLAQLDDLTPEFVRIHEIRGDSVQGRSIISIHGMVNANTEKETGIALNTFVSALKDIESVRLVTLGATSRVSLGKNRWGRQFSLEVELAERALPYKMLVDAQAHVNTRGAP